MTVDPISRSRHFFEVEYRKKRRVLKTKLLLHNRKLYLTHGMVLCLVTLTDLQTRRAGLSASAELLVLFVVLKFTITPVIYIGLPSCQWKTHKCLGNGGLCCHEIFPKFLTWAEPDYKR